MSKTIVIIGTLDTKGPETRFARDLVVKRGQNPLVIDCGMMGDVPFKPEITRDEVADAAGTDLESLRLLVKSDAVTTMSRGMGILVAKLLEQGEIHGILGLGGGQGTIMATGIMKNLPFGFPKVMVSAVANGSQTFGPFVGTRDICIIHSVADILGLNVITRKVIAEGVGAVIGMAETEIDNPPEVKASIGMTAAGVTTPCAMKIREILENDGYEVIAFHCNGVGAEAMENLAVAGEIQAVIDMSPKDIGDELYGGLFRAYPGRLKKLRDNNVPLVFIPGTLDFLLFGAYEDMADKYKKRKLMRHNPIHTHVRAIHDEMSKMGYVVGESLSGYEIPVKILIPEKGFTKTGSPGGPIHDPSSDVGFREGLEEYLATDPNPSISIESHPYNINEPEFAAAVADAIKAVMGEI